MLNRLEFVSLTIIDCKVDICFKELSSFVDNGINNKYKIQERSLCFDDIYSILPPKGGAHFSKFLIWEAKNLLGQTCFFSNYEDGRYTLIRNYCRQLKRKAISIAFSNKETLYPSFKFYFFDYSNNNDVERVISLIKDGTNWAFYTKGNILPFEDIFNYEKKLKTKRFNKEILLSYLSKMKIDITKKEFWQSTNGNAFYFDQISW